MQFSNLQTKRHFVAGKWIVGIDPAKDKFDAAVIDPMGILQGKTFTIQNNHDGFQMQLFNCLNKRIVSIPKENILFAIEAACNLWQKLANFLISKGFSVVIINPRSTHKSRSLINHNASKTDAKDALVVANAARGGYFDFYRVYPDQTRALHDLAVTYDKLKRSLAQAKLRLRALVELTFPEFTDIIKMNTQTAIYLLDNFITPQEFLDADVFSTVRQMKQVSRGKKGIKDLKQLHEAARESIGLDLDVEQIHAAHMARDCWINMIRLLNGQIDRIQQQIIAIARQKPYFDILTSIRGISDLSSALFIAELRDLSHFEHYKQVEAFAGLALRNCDSGHYRGYRHISRIGNKRLRSIIFRMTTEAKNHIPEVRIRFLNRKMIHDRYRKNITACASNLLKLIMALVLENRHYEFREEKVKELQEVEKQFEKQQEKKEKKPLRKAS